MNVLNAKMDIILIQGFVLKNVRFLAKIKTEYVFIKKVKAVRMNAFYVEVI